jgi:hypothetical protein
MRIVAHAGSIRGSFPRGGSVMLNNNKNIWLCIEALSAGLSCDDHSAEEVLTGLEADLKQLDKPSRSAMREKLICIVGQLSRLEVRMMAEDGHYHSAK